MSITNALENNFPTLVGFLGKKFVQTIFGSEEEFLALDLPDDKIAEYLDKEFTSMKFKKEGTIWIAHDQTANLEKEERTLEILRILEDSLSFLIKQLGESKLSSIRRKLKDPEKIWHGLHEAYVAKPLMHNL